MFTKHGATDPHRRPVMVFVTNQGADVMYLIYIPLRCYAYFILTNMNKYSKIITRHSSEPFQLCVLNYF